VVGQWEENNEIDIVFFRLMTLKLLEEFYFVYLAMKKTCDALENLNRNDIRLLFGLLMKNWNKRDCCRLD
jgi:hypothetical protein